MFALKRSLRLTLFLLSLGAAELSRAQATKISTDHPDSRVDIYGGYGYFHPLNSGIDGYQYQDVSNLNATVSVSAFFNKYVGLQAEGGYFSGNGEHHLYDSAPSGGCNAASCDQLVYTAEGGPIVRFPLGPFVPFVHILGGGAKINGPVAQPLFWGWGVTGGGGVDWVLPPFHHKLAIRLFQADFQYSQVVYGPLVLPDGTHGGLGEIDAVKLSGGLVLRLGDLKPPVPVQFGCTADPVSGYPGDPIKINGKTLGLNPKLKTKPVYTWSLKGGTISPAYENATVDTTGMVPGEYVANGHVAEGPRARQQASCNAPFTIKAYEPPTITCAANPTTATSGTDIQISTTGGSPQNRALTYSYSATAGEVTSSGPTAKLSTAGLSPSTITITCNVVDDLGKNATATTSVILQAPVAPVVPQTQPLCSLSFDRDKRRPVRVDNEAKGCLDDIALTLNQQADAHLIIVGNFAQKEKQTAAEERTLNARQYLVKEKGIDPSRIEVRIGSTAGKMVNNTLIPPGAVFNAPDTHPFDDTTVVRHGQAYGVPRAKPAPGAKPATKKHVAKKAAPAVTFGPGV
jgi:hypothetical protein